MTAVQSPSRRGGPGRPLEPHSRPRLASLSPEGRVGHLLPVGVGTMRNPFQRPEDAQETSGSGQHRLPPQMKGMSGNQVGSGQDPPPPRPSTHHLTAANFWRCPRPLASALYPHLHWSPGHPRLLVSSSLALQVETSPSPGSTLASFIFSMAPVPLRNSLRFAHRLLRPRGQGSPCLNRSALQVRET